MPDIVSDMADSEPKARANNVNYQNNAERDGSTSRLCPVCQKNDLAYDGCLNLSCPACGFTETGGAFT